MWFFLVLDSEKPEYAISHAYDASSEDIDAIFGVLTNLKTWIDARDT